MSLRQQPPLGWFSGQFLFFIMKLRPAGTHWPCCKTSSFLLIKSWWNSCIYPQCLIVFSAWKDPEKLLMPTKCNVTSQNSILIPTLSFIVNLSPQCKKGSLYRSAEWENKQGCLLTTSPAVNCKWLAVTDPSMTPSREQIQWSVQQNVPSPVAMVTLSLCLPYFLPLSLSFYQYLCNIIYESGFS